jgi:choline dehydrogenase-like flavoprotein
MRAGHRADGTPRARCIVLDSHETVCVKSEGRIYLSSGALHTPELLLKSGIGPSGRKVKNAKVSNEMQ